jgi:hypothetical protein
MTNPNSFDSAVPWQEGGRRPGDASDRAAIVRDSSGLITTAPPLEHAVLVGVELATRPQLLGLDDSLAELALLAKTAGADVCGRITQRLEAANPAT